MLHEITWVVKEMVDSEGDGFVQGFGKSLFCVFTARAKGIFK